jgi:AraC-like DNA-binding protein
MRQRCTELIKTSFVEAKYKEVSKTAYFHEDYSFIFIKNGVHTFENELKYYKLESDTIKIINPNKYHKILDSEFEYIHFMLPISYIKNMAKELYGGNIQCITFNQVIKDKKLNTFFLNIKNTLSLKDFNQEDFDEAVKYFTIEILRNHLYKLIKNDINCTHSIIADVKKYVYDNYDDNITLEDLEIHLYMNKFKIMREFKKRTKMSPIQYTYIIRTNIAKKLIDNTEYSLTEIAFICNFSDQSNMIKNFKKVFNYTPMKAKKSIRELSTREVLLNHYSN